MLMMSLVSDDVHLYSGYDRVYALCRMLFKMEGHREHCCVRFCSHCQVGISLFIHSQYTSASALDGSACGNCCSSCHVPPLLEAVQSWIVTAPWLFSCLLHYCPYCCLYTVHACIHRSCLNILSLLFQGVAKSNVLKDQWRMYSTV